MKETRELEKNQLEALQEADFAVSDEGEEEEDENEEVARQNLGVWNCLETVMSSLE